MVDNGDVGGYVGRRQNAPQLISNSVRIAWLIGVGDDPGGQNRFWPLVVHTGRSPLDTPQRHQCRVDLGGFEPDATHLDLLIGATVNHQITGCRAVHQVTGAIHARTGVSERVCHKASRGHSGGSGVSAGQPGSGQVQLADHALWHGTKSAVEYVGGCRPRGSADGNRSPRFHCRIRRRHDGGLGGTVEVDNSAP